MQFFNLKRIAAEDFSKEQQEFAQKFGSIWNSFVDNFQQFINHGVGYDNLNQEVKSFTFTTNSSGQPIGGLQFKTTLNGNINGIIITSIKLANSQDFVTTMPVITFSQDSSLITIKNISGLQNNVKYTLNALIV